jgi:hypothetical protein
MFFVIFGWFISSLGMSIVIAQGYDAEYTLKVIMYFGTIFVNTALAGTSLVYPFFALKTINNAY